MKAFFTLKVT